ncbi:hypothetical protein ACIBSW_09655 [Actinoplanes sp. NPDC049668]|uniref:hypothetical protein n=1 Tax=unclassified Actinoplanes TaxID=2626549 RepID=UPI0033B63C20
MPSEFELLRQLDDEPRTPSTVDVRRAVADGRRRLRARRAAGYGGAAAVTAIAVAGTSFAAGVVGRDAPEHPATGAAPSVAPAAPTGCTLGRLPVPDKEPMALVTGGDNTGRYLVGRTYPKAGGYQAVIWHDGKVRKVMLPGDLEESLPDVNSAGTAVGWSYTSGGPVPFVYRDGEVSKLPGVAHGSAYAINDAGVIVGDDDRAALLWPSATAEPRRLPVPAGASEATAADIDEDGTVAGSVGRRPYVWFPDGTHRELPMPVLDGKPATTGHVFAIRNGWATGVAAGGAGAKGDARSKAAGEASVSAAVRWNVRTGEARVFADLTMGATAVNAHGWQVGTDRQGRAVLVADRTVVLPDLAAHEPNGLGNIASSVSDDGRTIGGQSDDATGTIQAVVWRCR